MLSAADIAAMQATVTASLDLSCQIQRVTRTATATGGWTEGFATIATVSCNMSKPSASLLQIYTERIGDHKAWLVRFTANQDVRETDQLIIGGETLIVQVNLTPKSYEVGRQVLAVEVK